MAADAAAAFARLAAALGSTPPGLVEACAAAYDAPAASIFGVPTQTLSRILRLLKARAAPEARAEVEDAFMKIVTRVSPATRVGDVARAGGRPGPDAAGARACSPRGRTQWRDARRLRC
jgi:hypothetical protein